MRQMPGAAREDQQPPQPTPACAGGAIRGYLPGRETIAHVERVLQHRLDMSARVRVGDLAAAPDGLRQI
jgi:hypothetical protein